MIFNLFNKELYYKKGTVYEDNMIIGKVLPHLCSLVEEHLILIGKLKSDPSVYPNLNIDKESQTLTNYITWIDKYYYKYDELTGNCLETCPIYSTYKIGSVSCQKCKNNLGYSNNGLWVICRALNKNKVQGYKL